MAGEYDETLRFPTNLDRQGIEQRLTKVRQDAQSSGLKELAAQLADLAALSAAQLGTKVVAALNLMQEKPEHRAILAQLEIVAMNLKNLK